MWVVSIVPSVAAPFLSSALYATMDFTFVRNVSAVNLVLYVPLALASYLLLEPAQAVLGMQAAYSLPDLIVCIACLWRMHRLRGDGLDVEDRP